MANVVVSYESELSIMYKGCEVVFHRGDAFGRLKVVSPVRYRTNQGVMRKGCMCVCTCGKEVGPVLCASLVDGDTFSCGCFGRELHSELLQKRNFKHGQSIRGRRSKLYSLWVAMVDRARNTNRPDAIYYADKLGDDALCPDWLDFEKFAAWAEVNGYRDGLSIDRIRNERGYHPDNCRFINVLDQNRNKTSNRWLVYGDETHMITEWSRLVGLSWDVINRRLRKGLSVGQALGFE